MLPIFCLDVKIINLELSQSIQTNTKALFKFNTNNNEQENNKSSNLSNKTKNVNSKQKSSSKFFQITKLLLMMYSRCQIN